MISFPSLLLSIGPTFLQLFILLNTVIGKKERKGPTNTSPYSRLHRLLKLLLKFIINVGNKMCVYWDNKLFHYLLLVLLKVWEDPPPQGPQLPQVPRTILSLGKEKLRMDHHQWELHHRGQWPIISAHYCVLSISLLCCLLSFVADIT